MHFLLKLCRFQTGVHPFCTDWWDYDQSHYHQHNIREMLQLRTGFRFHTDRSLNIWSICSMSARRLSGNTCKFKPTDSSSHVTNVWNHSHQASVSIIQCRFHCRPRSHSACPCFHASISCVGLWIVDQSPAHSQCSTVSSITHFALATGGVVTTRSPRLTDRTANRGALFLDLVSKSANRKILFHFLSSCWRLKRPRV